MALNNNADIIVMASTNIGLNYIAAKFSEMPI